MFTKLRAKIRYQVFFTPKLRILCRIGFHSWGLDSDGYWRLKDNPIEFRRKHFPAKCFRCEKPGFMT